MSFHVSTLEIFNKWKFDASLETVIFQSKSPPISFQFSKYTMMHKTKPVITVKNEFEYKDKSILTERFGGSGVLTIEKRQYINTKKIPFFHRFKDFDLDRDGRNQACSFRER